MSCGSRFVRPGGSLHRCVNVVTRRLGSPVETDFAFEFDKTFRGPRCACAVRAEWRWSLGLYFRLGFWDRVRVEFGVVAVIPDPRAARSLRFSPSESVDEYHYHPSSSGLP